MKSVDSLKSLYSNDEIVYMHYYSKKHFQLLGPFWAKIVILFNYLGSCECSSQVANFVSKFPMFVFVVVCGSYLSEKTYEEKWAKCQSEAER